MGPSVHNAFLKYALQLKGQSGYVKGTKWGQVGSHRVKWDQVGSFGVKSGQGGLKGGE